MSGAIYDLKSKALIAQKAPYAVDVKSGEVKYWCTCGYSKQQPFCDGSHVQVNKDKGLNFEPMKWEAKKDETVYFCGCKRTNNPPLCDGAHAKLSTSSSPTPGEIFGKLGPLILPFIIILLAVYFLK